MARCALPLLLATLLACWRGAEAFPSIFVARFAGSDCLAHPSDDFGKVHGYTKAPDKTASFSLKAQSSGRAVAGKLCAGDSYDLQIDFSDLPKRNYLLTSSHGSLTADKNDCDPLWCDNRICSPAPVTPVKAVLKLPCDVAAGTQLTLKITTGNGRIPANGSTLRTATLGLTVEGACPGKCASSGGGGGSGSSTSSTSSSGSSAKPSQPTTVEKGGGSAAGGAGSKKASSKQGA